MKLDFDKYKWDKNKTEDSQGVADTMLKYMGQNALAEMHNQQIDKIKEDLRASYKAKMALLLKPKYTKKASHEAITKLGLLDELLAELDKE